MTDSWEDWENTDFDIHVPLFPANVQKIEEQRLIDEYEINLARDLIGVSNPVSIPVSNPVSNSVSNPVSNPKCAVNKNKKQLENERKQKEMSAQLKIEKALRKKERELYGESDECHPYLEYEDQFYK